jgi:hypothetical protein
MHARAWIILLTFEHDGQPGVRASVDGRVLLPLLSFDSPVEALDYVNDVLADFRAGDRVTLVALRAPPPFACWSTALRSGAVLWCAMAVAAVWYEKTFARSTRAAWLS